MELDVFHFAQSRRAQP